MAWTVIVNLAIFSIEIALQIGYAISHPDSNLMIFNRFRLPGELFAEMVNIG